MRRIFAVVLALTLLTACYHATIVTGAQPSTETVQHNWARSWIYGLVPPNTVETTSKCPKGVSKVETQHSFLNLVVGALTFGIFTPMTIEATCAA